MTNPYSLETERLIIRPFMLEDAEDLYAYLSRPKVMRYLYSEPRSLEEAQAIALDRSQRVTLEQADSITLACVLRSEGRVIGDVTLMWRSKDHLQGELGFVFNPDYQGSGLATEAALAILRLGFESYHMHRIIGRCDARNEPSVRLLTRLGMRCEAHLIEEEIFKGEWSSTCIFAMLDHEWRDRDPR
jgi:RimJ/RimL family protein N-acetyltransferase